LYPSARRRTGAYAKVVKIPKNLIFFSGLLRQGTLEIFAAPLPAATPGPLSHNGSSLEDYMVRTKNMRTHKLIELLDTYLYEEKPCGGS
jgi:hypothetical protein